MPPSKKSNSRHVAPGAYFIQLHGKDRWRLGERRTDGLWYVVGEPDAFGAVKMYQYIPNPHSEYVVE